MIIGQVFLAYFIVALSVGPIGRQLIGWGVPDLALIIIWLATWFKGEVAGLRWAIIFGLVYDAIGYHVFGAYTAFYLLIVFILLFLKSRYLTESGLIQALAVLAGACFLEKLIFGLIAQSWGWSVIGLTLAWEALIGATGYLAISSRYHFLQRWTGRILM